MSDPSAAWHLLLADGPLDGLRIIWDGEQLPHEISLRFRWPDFECVYETAAAKIELEVTDDGEMRPIQRYVWRNKP